MSPDAKPDLPVERRADLDDPRETPHEPDSGRPTGPMDPNGLRPGQAQETAPTVAPEERGEHPTTEHGPAGDL
jgi:hypothetical protein